jgi:hypothetical protein
MTPNPLCQVCSAPKWKIVANRYSVNELGTQAADKVVNSDYVPGEQEVVTKVFCSVCGIEYHLQSV